MTETTEPASRNPATRTEPTFDPVIRDLLDHHKAQATGHASRATVLERERDEARTALTAKQAEWEAKLAEREQHASRAVLRAEMKHIARAAGLKSPEYLAHLDLSKLKLDASGEIEGAAAAIEALKKARPELFDGAATTSSTASVPPPAGTATKTAREMSYAEWQAARAAMIARR